MFISSCRTALVFASALAAGPVLLANKDTLANQEVLIAGTGLTSPNGVYTAALTSEGEFVVTGAGGAVVWTNGNRTPGHLVMQEDNNVVHYDNAGVSRWCTQTWNDGARGQGRLVLDNEGVLRVHDGKAELWNAKTVGYGLSVGGGSSKVGIQVNVGRETARKAGAAVDKAKADVKKVLHNAKDDCAIM